MRRCVLLALPLLGLAPIHAVLAEPVTTAATTFTNPIADRGADPFVVREGDRYYYVTSSLSKDREIWIHEGETLLEALQAEGKTVWTPDPTSPWRQGLWAPELHKLDGVWYVYVAADDGKNENHRMIALRSVWDTPAGPYEFVGKVETPQDRWAIDGTVLHHDADGDGPEPTKPYFIWSGWEGTENVQQNLYIGEMTDPVTVKGPRVLISIPEHEWEKRGTPLVNEGPQVLQRKGKTFLIYSASGSWTDDYCQGMLTLVGEDPLKADSWKKHPAPVLGSTALLRSPGHPSFVETGAGEHWIIFHRARHPGAGWNRVVHTQRFTWDIEGNPAFGYPIPAGIPIAVPKE